MIRKWLRGVCLGLVAVLLLSGLSLAQAPAELKLPEGAVKISDAVPAMGEHWARPQDLPLGPIYLVWQGKIIGVEYMFTLAMLQRLAIPTPQGDVVFYDSGSLSVFGQKIDHLTVHYLYPGHPGFEVPHYDIHLYTITPAERYQIILNVPPPPAVSPAPGAAKPAGAVQLSPVVPAMGSHWAEPANLPFGPIYLADKAGAEIGVEFMYNHAQMPCQQVQEGPGGPIIWVCGIDFIPVGRTVDHLTASYLPTGHEGYTVWHFDLHLYSIIPAERGKIVP